MRRAKTALYHVQMVQDAIRESLHEGKAMGAGQNLALGQVERFLVSLIDRNRSISGEVLEARNELQRKGWTYRAAAPELGVSMTHLSWVLTGRRQSRRLLEAIAALPDRETSGR